MGLISFITGESRITVGNQTFVATHDKLASPVNTHIATIETDDHYIQGRGQTRHEALTNATEALEKRLLKTT